MEALGVPSGADNEDVSEDDLAVPAYLNISSSATFKGGLKMWFNDDSQICTLLLP